MTQVTQRSITRNQSTADYEIKHAFIWDNTFQNGSFKNTTGASFVLNECMLVARNTAVAGGLIPVTYTDSSTNNLADIIGIASQSGDITLASNASTNITYCTGGGVDARYLVLPAGVTLDTTVGNKALRDVIADLGIDLDNTTIEMTKFDN